MATPLLTSDEECPPGAPHLGSNSWGGIATARWTATIALGTGLLAAACGVGNPQGSEPALRVAAAASLREPAGAIAEAYRTAHPGARVNVHFGASSALAAQIAAGAPVDVLLSADERQVERLAAGGRIAAGDRAVFARNRLVVISGAELAPLLESAASLAGPQTRRIAIPDRAVPVGRYARLWLDARGLGAALEPRFVRTDHARGALTAVDLGHADAAIVYATDARVARRARVALEIPDAEQPEILYVAAAMQNSPRLAEARRFLAFLVGNPAQATLRRAGFRPAEPDAP